MQGIRDTLSGKQSAASPGDALKGENGWTEAEGCPLYTDDDFPRSVQQLEDTLGKLPDLDAFVPTGGFPQFIPDAYRATVSKYKDRLDSGKLALVVADTLPVQMELMKEGLSKGQVGSLIETVLAFLKSKLPAGLAAQLETLLSEGGLAGVVKKVTSMFGKS